MKIQWLQTLAMNLVVLSCASCASMSSMIGKTTYDPASYGTAALIETASSPKSVTSDAVAAARQLAKRNLTEEEGLKLRDALLAQGNWKVRVALLQTMAEKQMTYLRDDLAEYAMEAPDAETAVQAGVTVMALTSDQEKALKFAGTLLIKGLYPAQRARAARLIANTFPEYAERLFIKALEDETSASAATLMCEFLAQKGTEKSLPVLDGIANDVARIYQADKYLDNVKTTSESVRAAAVRGAERLRVLQ
ncbi:MAG TPA: hypothetical protein PLG04_02725 [Anaerolineaceae bacterium]|nr:hypothetical protein [Anaerolineaceae bacterium]